MAEKPKPDETPAKEKKKPSRAATLKALIVVGVVLLLEAGTIIGTIYIGGGPAEVKGEGLTADNDAEQNKLIEIKVVEGKFSNNRTGRTYIYDTEIFAVVRSKHADQFKEELESMKARIRSDIDAIFRGADPAYFAERERSTLTRQIEAAMRQRFGESAEGESIVHEAIIGKCIGHYQH